jgi:hypothetical protein
MKMKSLLLSAVATLGLTAASLAQTVPSYVPTNGLVGWWAFNGNANDESGNGNNGTVNGATLTSDRFGNANKAYSFDGVDDMIEIQETAILRCRKITISTWVFKLGNGQIGQIIYKGSLNSAQSEAYSINGSPTFAIKNNSSCIPGAGWQIINYNSNINNSVWSHVVGTYDGNTLKTYIDGVLTNSLNYMGLIDSCLNSNLRFG